MQVSMVEPGTLHLTRLKSRILASIPSLRAFQKGRDTLLAFDSVIRAALQRFCKEDEDSDPNYFAMAAMSVRKEMLANKSRFKGTFERKCQENFVSPSLVSLVKIILYGPNIESHLTSSSARHCPITSVQLTFPSP